MMFSFHRSLVSCKNAVTTPNIHSLYVYVAGRKLSNSSSHNQNDSNKMVDPKRVLSYEDMLEVVKEPQKVIIDVRNPDEVASTGQIPSSINIPLQTVDDTLARMSNEDFRRQFHRDKPSNNDELVFYCRSGRRSAEALDRALKLGYSNSKTYLGSWDEWSSKNK